MRRGLVALIAGVATLATASPAAAVFHAAGNVDPTPAKDEFKVIDK